MLIEIHMLQNHAPSNLNRDDTGSPKDCVFGGIRRSRISSQCLKRSIRRSPLFTDGLADVTLAMRTRRLPSLIRDSLLARGVPREYADIAATKATGFGTADGKERQEQNTAQTMFLTARDVETIVGMFHEIIAGCKTPDEFAKLKAKDLQSNPALKGWRPVTPDVALFGRMTTSDALRDVEASVQVAHAISTNKMEHEFDYFTAVDDLQASSDDSMGADMIGDVEFTSACFYKYFSLDLDGLVANLAGPNPTPDSVQEARELAAKAVEAFLQAAVFTSPSGKQNSFAAHQLPDAILVEVRKTKTPVSYSNAFVQPARPRGDTDLVQDSIDKMVRHASLLTDKFSLSAICRLWFTTRENAMPGTEECPSFDDVLVKLRHAISQVS